MQVQLGGGDGLIVAILVLFLGAVLTRRVGFLRRYSIPDAVTGGLICSSVIAALYAWGDVEISFDLRLRDVLLLVFFSTIGLSAKLRLLAAGGRALAILIAVAFVFLVIQDVTGVLLAWAFGVHPGYGLFAGSVSLAGGHGTAIAWGQVAEEAGLTGAKELGLGFATFGLIMGGMIGGPIAERLIARHGLRVPAADSASGRGPRAPAARALRVTEILGTLLALAVCVEAGDLVNRLLFSRGVTLPGFLTAMLVGIAIANTAEPLKLRLSETAIERTAEIALPLFLAMSLMSMQLWTLAGAFGVMLVCLAAQALVMTFFTVFIVFRVMGRDYDASVIAAGFAGLGLGATPVGIANMNAITSKYGPSAKAFLVIPLVGAFFIDLANATVIRFFMSRISDFMA